MLGEHLQQQNFTNVTASMQNDFFLTKTRTVGKTNTRIFKDDKRLNNSRLQMRTKYTLHNTLVVKKYK